MKVAILPSSEVFASGRWDANFHVLSNTLRDKVIELRQSIDDDRALEMLAELRTSDLRCLAPLTRTRKMDRDQLLSAAVEFPHLALAIVQLDLERAIPEVVHDLAAQQRYLDTVTELAAELKAATTMRP